MHLGPTQIQKEDTRTYLAQADFAQDAVRHGVVTYRLLYRTVDAHGRPTIASGLLVLPDGGDRDLRTVSFTHGTASFKEDAPSRGDTFSSSPAITYASAGFAAVAPDYLGLGFGPGTHPWMDVPSETTASVDMLRAARAFVPRTGRTLRREVLVTGFSQGASAAMGLARALREGADPWFRLRALAPISGGYDFRRAQIPAMLAGEVDAKLSVAYTAYLLVSYDRVHDLYDTPAELFRAPYADRVEGLFDGTTPGGEMLGALPATLDELLTPRGLEMLRRPAGRFAAALRVADGTCTGWNPSVPFRLFMARDDEQAVNANTEHCRTAFEAHGVRVPVVELEPHLYAESVHLGTSVTGAAAVASWFGGLS